jgi:thioredoxin-dependent peroxiredoxin
MTTQVLKTGDAAPAFVLKNQDGETVRFKDFARKWVVMYFYPKDMTPGCTIEAHEFTNLREEFEKNGGVVFGVSADNIQSHKTFCEREGLGVTLLSDTDAKICSAYGVWAQKDGGKMGVARTTFLVAPGGKIAEIWRNVQAAGHADAVLKRLNELNK